MKLKPLLQPRPDLTREYPAIDGIESRFVDAPKRNHGDVSDNYTPTLREKLAVRSDVEKILEMPDEEFNVWYAQRKSCTEQLLEMYSTFASIPNLNFSYEDTKYDMSSMTLVKNQLEYFRRGLDNLEVIKQRRSEYQQAQKVLSS